MNLHVSITTCDRPPMLARLLRQIYYETSGTGLSCLVVDDATEDVEAVVRAVNRCPWVDLDTAVERCGKHGFWEIMDVVLSDAEIRAFDYWFHLPDDVELEPGFFSRAIEYLKPESVLNPLRVNADYTKGNFASGLPRKLANGLYRTDWNDCCWVADRAMGEALEWEIYPVDQRRWDDEPGLSSGVGSQITTRLIEKGIEMYQVPVSLLRHGDHPSIMNPEERKRTPLIA